MLEPRPARLQRPASLGRTRNVVLTKTQNLAAGATALSLSLVLAGCVSPYAASPGAEDPAGGATPSASEEVDPSRVDWMFVTMMIPHHEEAIEMAHAALSRQDLDPRIAELAEQIISAQGAEIEKMQGWLDEWNLEGHGMGGMNGMNGMAPGQDMSALEAAEGDAADRLFLEQMIAHHRSGVEMATVAAESGRDPRVRELARQMAEVQTDEIVAMNDLLAGV